MASVGLSRSTEADERRENGKRLMAIAVDSESFILIYVL